jgi:glycosyltransferase involved in cell wall biosynthesis
MKDSLVSIIIPVYNAERFLKESIESVLSQTYRNIEVILVNDGSVDSSRTICEEYKFKDPRIKVIHQENLGPSSARNAGILLSKGDYMQFVDADDKINSTMVEELLLASKTGVDLVLCGYCSHTTKTCNVIPDNEGVFSLSEFTGFFSELFKKTLINSPCNKLYQSNVIRENKLMFPLDINIGEDLLFNIDYLRNCKKVFLLKSPLYHYYKLENFSSLTKLYKRNYFENRKAIFKRLNNFIEEYAKDISLYNDLIDMVFSKYVLSSITNLFHKDAGLNRKKRKEQLIKIVEDQWVSRNIRKIKKNTFEGILIRSLIKHKNISGISLYFNVILILKRKLKMLYYFIKNINGK